MIDKVGNIVNVGIVLYLNLWLVMLEEVVSVWDFLDESWLIIDLEKVVIWFVIVELV